MTKRINSVVRVVLAQKIVASNHWLTIKAPIMGPTLYLKNTNYKGIKTMPKFNGQNKKRIDPRYFLNETTNRDQLEENLMNPEQRSINARPVYYRLKKLLNKPEFSQYVNQLDTLMQKVSKTVAKQDGGLSDEEFTELTSASRDDSSLRAFQDRVMAMVSQGAMSSGGDADADGTSDREELMKIAQNMPEPTDDLGRTEFDQLEYDIEALFSDSAFMNTIGRSEVDKINDVIAKVQKSGSGRSADLVPDSVVAATDEEKAQLAAAAKESSAALFNVIKQMA